MTNAWDDTEWFQYVVYGSSLMYAFMALLIWRIKDLQVHPMRLVMYIMICDSLVLWAEAAHNQICKWQSYKLFSLSVFFSNSYEAQARSINLLAKSKFCIDSGFYNAAVMLDICLCFDLVLMINRPLQSKEKRMRVYKIFGFLTLIISTVVRLFPKGQKIMNISYGMLLLIYILSAFFSSVFVIMKLTNTNITPRIRSLILRRHVMFIFFYISVNIYVFWTFIYLYRTNNEINGKNTFWARLFKGLYFL